MRSSCEADSDKWLSDGTFDILHVGTFLRAIVLLLFSSSASLFKRLSIEPFDTYYNLLLLRWTGQAMSLECH
jgi:hypothetical protein